MDDVLAKANDLAEAIRASDRYRTLRSAETVMAGDEAAQKLTHDLEEAQRAIADKEKAQQPIEVAEKREFARLQEEVKSCDSLQGLLKAQADFFELMNRVNGAIQSVLAPADEE